MSNINTYANSNTLIQELSDQDLVNCSGGSHPVGGAPHGNVFGPPPGQISDLEAAQILLSLGVSRQEIARRAAQRKHR
jgi:hypothetical protein